MYNYKLDEIRRTIDGIKIPSFSWLPFWMAGFLFTVGYVFDPVIVASQTWYESVIATVLTYIMWPLILGVVLK